MAGTAQQHDAAAPAASRAAGTLDAAAPVAELVPGRRVAIVHERFLVDAGSERVVEQWHLCRPDAPILAALCDRAALPAGLRGAAITASSLDRFRRKGAYAHLLPLLPAAFRRMDLGEADVVLVSHHAYAQHVRPDPAAFVASYVHTPARWMWDPALRRVEGGPVTRTALGLLAAVQRPADRRAATRPDLLVANSTAVRERIRRWWGRDAVVVHPPVDVERFTPPPQDAREAFFLYAGRLAPYKRPLVAVAAARAAGVPLVVAGDGRLRREVEAAGAAGPGVEVLGAVDDETLAELYRRCRALLHPGTEDFGIVAVEAQACGAPVIARDAGGARDTVVDGVTGVRYRVPGAGTASEVDALAAAIRGFDPARFDPAATRAHATRFAAARFRAEFAAVLASGLAGATR